MGVARSRHRKGPEHDHDGRRSDRPNADSCRYGRSFGGSDVSWSDGRRGRIEKVWKAQDSKGYAALIRAGYWIFFNSSGSSPPHPWKAESRRQVAHSEISVAWRWKISTGTREAVTVDR